MSWVYVGHASNSANYSGVERRGQYWFELSGPTSTGAASFYTWDAATKKWITRTYYERISGQRVFGKYAEGSDGYRLYRLYDFNSRIYGSNYRSYNGTGSKYTLRYQGRIYRAGDYNPHGSPFLRLPAGYKVDIPYGYGYTYSSIRGDRYHNLIRIAGYFDSNGRYHSLSSDAWLDEPVVDYYPSSYNINTY